MSGKRKIADDVAAARDALRRRLAAIVGDDGDIPRLAEALTHPSFANEAAQARPKDPRLPDNQRLEFLGDAVLGLCVGELLVKDNPTANEGTLSRMRSALVNADTLARWARAENLGASLALGRGARALGDHEQTNVLADAVEAVVAAIYEARGLECARALVHEVVREPLAEAPATTLGRDAKSILQELVQGQGSPAPIYRVVASRMEGRDPIFEVAVSVNDRELGRGEGRSKQTAERAAAAAALAADSATSSAR
jgi:ribonuclease III